MSRWMRLLEGESLSLISLCGLLCGLLPLAQGLVPSMAVPNKFLVVGGTG